MSSIIEDRTPVADATGTPERSAVRMRWLSPRVAVALATFGVAAGALVAVFAARVAHVPDLGWAAGLGALGAVGAGVAAIAGFLVLKRTAAGYDYAILEAASPTHPLVRRLMVEAPGTYAHSLAVANLAEAAAEAIGADALVTRVGAYYHDAGKLSRPCFFFENQEDDTNPHEASSPSASAGIIKAHVTDGLELARQYRLPPAVCDIIRQHHGTSLVRYFYHKAAKADAGVYEADFRYPGSPPSSREAAIVMLADASEASVRAMSRPDVHRIEECVRSVVAERTGDGQLADSGLSASDIESVVAVFVRQLVSFRHVRCAYPAD